MDTLNGAPSFKTPCKAHYHDHRVTKIKTTKVAEGANKEAAVTTVEAATGSKMQEESGRERLKRHRGEVAGRVWIPETWGQEDFLKDWIDCSAFDASLAPARIMSSARAALVEERRRAAAVVVVRSSSSTGLSIRN